MKDVANTSGSSERMEIGNACLKRCIPGCAADEMLMSCALDVVISGHPVAWPPDLLTHEAKYQQQTLQFDAQGPSMWALCLVNL